MLVERPVTAPPPHPMTNDTAEIPEPVERTGDQPVVLVSNRGPVSYGTDGSVKRGTGGLVTALMGLASHRQSVWVASSLTEGDRAVAEEPATRPSRSNRPPAARSTCGS